MDDETTAALPGACEACRFWEQRLTAEPSLIADAPPESVARHLQGRYGWCRRFPKWETTWAGHGCFEFQRKEIAR